MTLRSRLQNSLLVFILLMGLFGVTPVHAQNETGSTSHFNVFDILSTEDSDISGDIIADAEAAGISPVASLILRVINILTLLVGTFAFLMFLIGGFMFVTAQGNETTIDRAKGVVNQSMLGLVLAFASYFIVTLVQSLFY